MPSVPQIVIDEQLDVDAARDAALTLDDSILADTIARLDGRSGDGRFWRAVCRVLFEGEDPDDVATRVSAVHAEAAGRGRIGRAVASAASALRLLRERSTAAGLHELANAMVALEPLVLTADAGVAAELIGYAYGLVAPYQDTAAWTRAAIEAADAVGARSRSLLLRVRLATWETSAGDELRTAGDHSLAAVCYERALRLLDDAEAWAADDPMPLEAHMSRCWSLIFLDRHQEASPCAEVVAHAADPWWRGIGLHAQAEIAAAAGGFDEAIDKLRAAADIFRAQRNEIHLLEVLESQQRILYDACRFEHAARVGAEALQLSHRVLTRRGNDLALAVQATVDHLMSDAEARTARARVAELSDLAGRLELAANRDIVTGLGNRRWFDSELARLEQSDEALVCAIIDVDHFKIVNDVHTHTAGDIVLRTIGAILASDLRSSDVVARWAGDEFAVVFVNAGLPHAIGALERVRRDVEALRWPDEWPGLRVTVTIGGTVRRLGEPLGTTLARADVTLFSAKRSGRNRVATET